MNEILVISGAVALLLVGFAMLHKYMMNRKKSRVEIPAPSTQNTRESTGRVDWDTHSVKFPRRNGPLAESSGSKREASVHTQPYYDPSPTYSSPSSGGSSSYESGCSSSSSSSYDSGSSCGGMD